MKNRMQIGILTGLLVVLFSFQNCSDVSFNTAQLDDSNTYDGKVDYGVDLNNLPGLSESDEEINWDEEIPQREVDKEIEEHEEALSQCERSTPHKVVDYNGADLSLSMVRGHSNFTNIAQLELYDLRGVHQFTGAQSVSTVQQMRGINIIQAADSGKYIDLKGISCIATNSLNEANHMRGIEIFYGPANSRGAYGSISDVRGVLHLKNVELNSLSNFRGVLILENASVANFSQVNAVVRDLTSGQQYKFKN